MPRYENPNCERTEPVFLTLGGETLSAVNPLPVVDPWLQQSIYEILQTYGDTVVPKGKVIGKFGRTTNADDGVKTTIATFGSVATVNVNETFSTTNDIDKIASSSADDTETLTIEGHSIDAEGNLTFVVQSKTLTGQTPATLDTALARCSRVKVAASGSFGSPAGDLVGDIYAYASSGVTVTSGVPQTSTAVKARIVAGDNQTAKAATTISSVDYWCISRINASVEKGNSATVTADIELETRDVANGGVWLPVGLELSLRAGATQTEVIELRPYVIIPKNHDVRLIAVSNTNDTQVSASFAGPLMIVQ